MDLDSALQTFIIESRELLEQMETLLLALETEPDDREALNGVFRAAHTIKGSSGLFGLDAIVGFTHLVEGLLDQLRGGEIRLSSAMISTLLECRDHIDDLVEVNAVLQGELNQAQQARGVRLMAALQEFMGGSGHADSLATVSDSAEAGIESLGGGEVASDTWHISVRFSQTLLRSGMDPLSFIRYLGRIGQIASMTTITDAIPEADAMDPECCYLGFEINLASDCDKNTIEDVFEFIQEDCSLYILPPHGKIDDFIALIRKLPEDDLLLGEALVASGALTRKELELGLACQEEASGAEPLGKILVDRQFVQQPLVDAALDKQKQVKESKAQEAKSIRVHADKLDQLINLVGELVIAGAGANLLARRIEDSAMQESTSLISRLVDEIRDAALTLRMVEIGETFSRFQRVVRDVSRELGKDIALEISGAETELDKTVVEKIGDPLLHLVRNAMDHGIEPEAVRVACGKPARGTLRLNAFHDSGGIVIEVTDDGGGLKREKILQKAIEKGLVSAGQVLSDSEVYNLIFEPGFSTADAVTNLSGRGVGMDVVKRNITELRGTVEIESSENKGTTVRIRLPLTLAIIDGFLVGVAKSGFVVPLDMVLECIELSEQDRRELRDRNYINLRGEVLPFIRLRDRFDIDPFEAGRENVVVVKHGGNKAGLVVDELLGEFQTVIKPLGQMFRNLKGISGSTILGSGEVALILNVPALISQAVESEACGKMAVH